MHNSKIICDENIPVFIVDILKQHWFDASRYGSISPWDSDYKLSDYCYKNRAILITQDKDFGTIVYFSNQKRLPVAIVFCKVELYKDRDKVAHDIIFVLWKVTEWGYYIISQHGIKVRRYVA